MRKTAKLGSLLVSLVAAVITAFPQNGTVTLEGNWMGALDLAGAKLRLVLKVEKGASGYTAKLDSIDQGAKDLPIDTVTFEGGEVAFAAAQFGMAYKGAMNGDGNEIVGKFSQGGSSSAFVFTRISEAPKVLTRPQDPVKPYPYNEESVTYRNVTDNLKLAGTLTLPRAVGKHSAVILISGSGGQDRDSFVFGHRPFLVLADHLTRNGIAVLRVDDRGMGESELGSLDATSENFMGDVLAGVEFLKSRNDIDPKKIGLIGHSEGGIIAPMVAAKSRDIAFIVLLAGMGQRGEDVIYTQNELLGKAAGTPADAIANNIKLARSAHAVLKAHADKKQIEAGINGMLDKYAAGMTDADRKAFEPAAANIRSSMGIYTMPWFRYFIMFDPVHTLKQVKVPVLALNGELDLQVAYKENLGPIAAALKAGKNKDVTTKSFPKLNHLFQTSQTGQISEYAQIDETFSPEVLTTISEWIRKRLSKLRERSEE